MSRKSTRITQLPKNYAAEDVAEDKARSGFEPEATSDLEFEVKAPRRSATTKKATRKGAGRTISRRRGKLRQMLDMPLDVISEICSHLLPKDLLNLARTSKSLRSFFMSRNSQSIWKAACSNLPGFPPSPSDLSEPAYANLIFDTHCHDCMKRNCNNNHLYPQMRIRLCKSCGYSRLQSEAEAKHHSGLDISGIATSHKLHDVLPEAAYRFLDTQTEELAKQLRDLPSDARAAFLDERHKLVLKLREHARLVENWLDDSAISRAEELRQLRVSRREAILEQLREEGWQEDIKILISKTTYTSHEFEFLPEVRKSQALTPKIWKNIRGPVIALMEKIRESRITAVRKETIRQRLAKLSVFTVDLPLRIPGFSMSNTDIALSVPEAFQLIDPAHPDFDPQDLEVPIHRCFETRSEQMREVLAECIIRECGLDETTDPFSLAVGSLFVCKEYPCQAVLSLEQATKHEGHGSWYMAEEPASVSHQFFTIALGAFREKGRWSPEWCEPTVPKVMVKIVEASGLDPKTATVGDMNRADVRLRCVCATHEAGSWRPIMTWCTAAVQYAESRGRCNQFVKATAAEIAAAEPLEAAAIALRRRQWDEGLRFLCRHCSVALYMTKHEVIGHILESHAIETPSEADWVDTHNSLQIPSPVWLVSEELRNELLGFPLRCWFREGVATYFEFE